MIDYTVT